MHKVDHNLNNVGAKKCYHLTKEIPAISTNRMLVNTILKSHSLIHKNKINPFILGMRQQVQIKKTDPLIHLNKFLQTLVYLLVLFG